MSQADLEVVRVVGGRDLDRAGAEFGVDVGVGDDRDAAVLERMRELGADEMPVALVIGMHSDRGVTQHRFQTRGRHHQVRLIVVEGAVSEGHQLALDLVVLDL